MLATTPGPAAATTEAARRYPFLRGRVESWAEACAAAADAPLAAVLPLVEVCGHQDEGTVEGKAAGVLVLGLMGKDGGEGSSSTSSSGAAAGLNGDLWRELMAFMTP